MLRIANYGTASTESAAYILGGISSSERPVERISTIAQLQDNVWRKIGDLNEVKSDSSAIFHNGEFLIIGGDADSRTGRLVN